jgi:hypothetical protein
MSRNERGGQNDLAGVDLVVSMRNMNLAVPVVIYASPQRSSAEAMKR